MLFEQQVPRSLWPVLARQAVHLRPASWDADVEALIEHVARLPSAPPEEARGKEPEDVDVEQSPPEVPPHSQGPGADHYEELVRGIAEGSVVPCLGPGVNSSDRVERWEDVGGGCVPDAGELAAYLAAAVGLSGRDTDLAEVSQYIAVAKGSPDLYRLLRRSLAPDCVPRSVHTFLAGIPRTLHPLGPESRCQLIVTTNYDRALEQAFDAAEEEYDLAVYMANGPARGKFVHVSYDGDSRVVDRPNDYRGFKIDVWGQLERTVIVKIHGAVEDPKEPGLWHDNYVITEDDYIDYLSRSPVESIVPQQILGKLRESHLLFLGYTMRDWNLRVFLQRIFGARLPDTTSWAIQQAANQLDTRFWRRLGVEAFAIPLGQYIDDAGRHLSAVADPAV
jgi:hypothetical protein